VVGFTEIWQDWAFVLPDAAPKSAAPSAAALRAAPQPFAQDATEELPIFIPLKHWKCTNNPRNNPLRWLNTGRRKTPNPVKKFIALPLLFLAATLWTSTSCTRTPKQPEATPAAERAAIAALLDRWHQAAAQADSSVYFGALVPDSAVFIGTDDTERWKTEAFRTWSRPHFQNGKGWTFRPQDRKIGLDAQTAWVDERLDSPHMGACRGTAVLRKINGEWKIALYSLSFSVPNPRADAVMEALKSPDFPADKR
jgi:hypothetical protein